MLLRLCCLVVIMSSVIAADAIRFPAGINHGEWNRLLSQYVNAMGHVNYSAWHQNQNDRQVLDAYLKQYEPAPMQAAQGADFHAGLLNVYNALVVRDVLRQFPIKNYWEPTSPFKQAVHLVGGVRVSLDDIEHKGARPAIGYLAHVGLVCAAKSCPHLAQGAFVPDQLTQQLEERMRLWIANPFMNAIQKDKNIVEVSQLFNWFAGDFIQVGGPIGIIKKYGSSDQQTWLQTADAQVVYKGYDTSLNGI